MCFVILSYTQTPPNANNFALGKRPNADEPNPTPTPNANAAKPNANKSFSNADKSPQRQ